jgi:hypothetical protein
MGHGSGAGNETRQNLAAASLDENAPLALPKSEHDYEEEPGHGGDLPGAKGAAPSVAWGNAPGFAQRQTTSAESAIHSETAGWARVMVDLHRRVWSYARQRPQAVIEDLLRARPAELVRRRAAYAIRFCMRPKRSSPLTTCCTKCPCSSSGIGRRVTEFPTLPPMTSTCPAPTFTTRSV